MKTSKFFEFGEVSLVAFDETKRQAAILITIPCCLMQTITPALLGGGHIDQYELRNPVAVWIPSVDLDRYKSELIEQHPQISDQVGKLVKDKIEDILKTFKEISVALNDPSDFIPILPMGIYVKFRLRCDIDEMAKVLLNLENTMVAGVPEFRFALAEILAEILADI
jgi:hypothetical protein